MSASSILKKIAIGILIVILLGVSARFLGNILGPADNGGNGDNIGDSDHFMVFDVSIPSYTPEKDAICIRIWNDVFLMEKIGSFHYQYRLIESENYQSGATIKYGYSRGGFDPFAEPGMTPPNWSRSVVFENGKTVTDTVQSWKWYPTEDLNETDILSNANTAVIADRDDFWKGALMIDFWTDSFEYQFNSTIDHMQSMGYEWVALAPPWDIKDEDTPLLDYVNVTVPSYPDDKLRLHIQVFKDAGFKVILMPQICCTQINVTDRDATWWNAWYDQLEKFVQYHADVAKDEGVDALEFGTSLYAADLQGDTLNPSFINATAKWIHLIDIAKSSGALVGFQTYGWSATYDDLPLEDIRPWPYYAIDFADQLDFMGINLWGAVVNISNPVQADFDAGMERMFTQMEGVHNDTGLPIIIPQVAYPSRVGAGLEKGPETYYTWGEPEDAPYTYSAEEQAMIYEAIMRQVAKRDYIMGVFPFGYWYVDAPLTVDDMSIRAKMAERILVSWYERFNSSLQLQTSRLDIQNMLSIPIPILVITHGNPQLTYQPKSFFIQR